MAKREKPATAGERAEMRWRKMKLCQVRCFGDTRARAEHTDRAIARAVKRERLRCMALITNARDATPYTAVPKATISRVLCSIEEGEQP